MRYDSTEEGSADKLLFSFEVSIIERCIGDDSATAAEIKKPPDNMYKGGVLKKEFVDSVNHLKKLRINDRFLIA